MNVAVALWLLSCVFGFSAFSSSVHAQDASRPPATRASMRMLYSAPAECPSREDFEDLLAARLGYSAIDANAEARATVEIRSTQTSAGLLELRANLQFQPSRAGAPTAEDAAPIDVQRELSASPGECLTLAQSVAFSLALVLDPLGATPTPPVPAPPVAVPPVAASEPAPIPFIPFGHFANTPDKPEPLEDETEEVEPTAAIFAALGANYGALSNVAFGLDLGFRIRLAPAFDLELRSVYLARQQMEAGTHILGVQSFVQKIGLCGAWALSLCFTVGVGGWFADIRDLRRTSIQVPLGVNTRLRLFRAGIFEMHLFAGIDVQLMNAEVYWDDQRIFSQSSTMGDLRLEGAFAW